MGTILGGLYFEEFDNMSYINGIVFSIAILLTVIGVFILALNSGVSRTNRLSMSESTDDNSNDIITALPDDLFPSEIYGLHRALSALSAIRNENKVKVKENKHKKQNNSMPIINGILEIDVEIDRNKNNNDNDGIVI